MLENIKTTKEAAKMLKVTQEHVAWLCRNGLIIGAIKKGKTWLITEDALKVFIHIHGSGKKAEANKNDNDNIEETA